MNSMARVTAGRRNSNWLPVLVFLFVVSYGLLTMLVVFQDRTIDAQNDLIHLLLKSNRPLKVSRAAQQSLASGNKHIENGSTVKRPSSQAGIAVPPAQVPMGRQASEIPSSQQEKRADARKRSKIDRNLGKRSPFTPPSQITDPSDKRRSVLSI